MLDLVRRISEILRKNDWLRRLFSSVSSVENVNLGTRRGLFPFAFCVDAETLKRRREEKEMSFLELDFDEKIDNLAALLTAAPKIAFLTGAGISTESGIPDFRSSTGIYQTTSQELFEIEAFCANPEKFYRTFAPFYREITSARPNAGHLALVELEKRCGKKVFVVTQNIDGLHTVAGSTNVAEIHGTLRTATCLNCEAKYERPFFDADVAAGRVPKCEKCGGVLKPDVTFFGEALPERELAAAQRAMWETRFLGVLGTSLQVFPAAGLPRECDSDVPFVVVNKTPTPLDRTAEVVFYDSIGVVLPQALARVPTASSYSSQNDAGDR